MQPVQLSLMPDQVPGPHPAVVEQVPEPQLAAAIATLAGLIAKAAAAPVSAEPAEQARDE